MDLAIIEQTPSQLLLPERLLLYALVCGLRPACCLEIGTAQGGSALLISAAMDVVGYGKLFTIDPAPRVAPEHLALMAHHVEVLPGQSPDAVSLASRQADATFDLVFIDGDHTRAGVTQDIDAVVPYLSDECYLIFHDAHFMEIREAIDDAKRRYSLIDCGLMSKAAVPTGTYWRGQEIIWDGLRVLRWVRRRTEDVESPPAKPLEVHLQESVRFHQEELSRLQGALLALHQR